MTAINSSDQASVNLAVALSLRAQVGFKRQWHSCLASLRTSTLATPACLLCALLLSARASNAEDAGGIPNPTIATSFPAIADPGGIRKVLAPNGIEFGLNYIGDVMGNASGGMRQGAVHEGRFELVVDANLEKLYGWQGSAFHFNAYQIHGNGLSRYYTSNLMPTSNVEALPSTRLYEVWFEQKLAQGKLAIRVGQLAADTEFLTNNYAGLFLNGTFGWPQITASNLPSGGPAYPLATPGVRLKYTPNDQWTFLGGIFNGDPAGPGTDDPQLRNRYGVNFRMNDDPLLIGEAQYAYNQGKDALGLSGTLKVGAWQHFGSFNDLRFDTNGMPLADPASNQSPANRRGNYGVYAMINQQIYRLPGDDPTKGVGVFARVSGSPDDRNLVSFYADGGLNFNGMLKSRPDDSFGVSFAYTGISRHARGFDADTAFFKDLPQPIRNHEALIELTYQAQILPGWTLQPDFQYIFHPGGNVPNPLVLGSTVPIRDAAVFGIRTTIKY